MEYVTILLGETVNKLSTNVFIKAYPIILMIRDLWVWAQPVKSVGQLDRLLLNSCFTLVTNQLKVKRLTYYKSGYFENNL